METQPQAETATSTKSELIETLEAGQIVQLAHKYMRDALDLPEDAPSRFDYYAQCILEHRDEIIRLNDAAMRMNDNFNKLSRLYSEAQLLAFKNGLISRSL